MDFNDFSGLSASQVAEKKAAGQHNDYDAKVTKTTGTIIRENTMTLFNLLNFILAVCLFLVHAYSNMFFIAIILLNIVIGIVQEVRAKKMVEKLTLISQQKVAVMRDGQEVALYPTELVLNDVVCLSAGDQVPSDMKVLAGQAEVNESLLTGEADAINKNQDSEILSGSYLTSGQLIAEVIHVGADNYATKIIDETKEAKPIRSELTASIRKISKFTSWVIIPIGIILFAEAFLLRSSSTSASVVASVAALLGMLPKGLVLLISIALSAGVIKLAKKNVLVQNMYAIENLAHMNVLCLDKTGTITQGKMKVEALKILDASIPDVKKLIGSYLKAANDNNLTAQAMKEYFGENSDFAYDEVIPFSSERKYGAVRFAKVGTVYLGSPENLLPQSEIPEELFGYQDQGMRTLLIALDETGALEKPQALAPLAFITLSDPIRENAKETLAFFKKQDVALKIISGDNPNTVAAIAEKAGFEDYQSFIDLSQYQDEAEIRQLAHSHSIFGRVTPQQKKLLIQELKGAENIVGMTGDGVNDVLALREADISIAMAEGDGATRQIADLVLLDSNFGSLPHVIYEGRRVINNVTRSSGVFFIKTIYSFLVSLFCILTATAFPFIPLQITLIDLAIEGYPAFFLSFEEDPQKVKGPFLPEAFRRALPSGLLVVLNIIIVWILGIGLLTGGETRTLMYYLLIGISCMAVVRSCMPFNPLRIFLAVTTTLGSFVAIMLFHSLLSVNLLNLLTLFLFVLIMVINLLLWPALARPINKLKFNFLR